MKKKIHIVYYALLRQERGIPSETVESAAQTAEELYSELQALHAFRLPQSNLRVAINSKVCNWDATLKDGDAIVFIPPVAGG